MLMKSNLSVTFGTLFLAAAGVLAGGLWPVQRAHAQTEHAEAEAVPTEVIPTDVIVRAVAQDAKVLHDAVGGARITIRERSTGRILARGVQQGGSGSTEQIMRQPHRRGEVLYATPGTAGFRATLKLERPTIVEISAEGPLAYPQATRHTTTTMLLVPGRDVLGDGVVLTLRGFIVTIEAPGASSTPTGDSLGVRATVRMLCGCPTEPGGLWDASEIDVEARLLRNGEVLARTPLHFAGETSTYGGALAVPGDGTYTLEVLAMDADKVNFGRAQQQVTVGED